MSAVAILDFLGIEELHRQLVSHMEQGCEAWKKQEAEGGVDAATAAAAIAQEEEEGEEEEEEEEGVGEEEGKEEDLSEAKLEAEGGARDAGDSADEVTED